MAITRSIVFAAFVANLFFILPGFVSAQDVYEVRTSSDDYVIVGTHDTGATLDEVVALARRLTGNAELTSEDVLANLPHARRYVCRAHGRQIYFGPDPDYGGRCPEDATRSMGILGGTRYRIPRTHGAVLPPPVRRVSAVRPTASSSADVAEAEARALAALRDVERLTTERDDYRRRYEESEATARRANDGRDEALEQLEAATTALETVRAELAEAHRALAVRPESRTITVTDPAAAAAITRLEGERDALRQQLADARRGEVGLNSPFHGRPLWAVFVLVIVLMISLFLVLYGLVIRPLTLRPHLAYRARLETEKTQLEGQVMETGSYLRTAETDLKKEIAKTKSLTKRRKRLIKAVVYYRRLRERMEHVMADALEKLKELKAFQDRKDAIAKAHSDLAALRDQEEPYLNAEALLQEAMEGREEATSRGDEKAVLEYSEAVKIYEENLASLGDPSALRAEIAGLVALLAREMQLQCGIAFDIRSADERLGEWEDRKREELRKLRAKSQTYEALAIEVMKAERTRAEEHTAAMAALTRRELEEAFLADPAQTEAPVNGSLAAQHVRQPRPRRITEDFERQQATPALHGFITRLLDEAETRPEVPLVLMCDEYDAGGLAVFLHNASVVCPQLQDPVRLRDFPGAIEALDPAMLTQRRIRPPSGTNAPANTSP